MELPKDLKKIVITYALNNFNNIDLDILYDSFRNFTYPKTISVFEKGFSDRLAYAQNFEIIKIFLSHDPDESDITIVVNPLKYKQPRVKISVDVLKQVFKYLFSIHGLKVTIKSKKEGDLYKVYVSNIRKNTYTEIYIPGDDVFGQRGPYITQHKYNRLSEDIISEVAKRDLEELFGISV